MTTTPWKLPARLPPAPGTTAWVVQSRPPLRRLRMAYWGFLLLCLGLAGLVQEMLR